MIATTSLPELVCVGLTVSGTWQELPKAVPAGWERLFAAAPEAENFLEVSRRQGDGTYAEFLGFLAAGKTEIPDSLERHVVAPGRYLRLRHDGPLADIAGGFARLHAHAEAAGMTAGALKLDFGYRRGLPDTPHELYLGIAPEPLALGGSASG
ncbi:GyrI-like domain-containing protein [Martelella mediterranea]|uniref:Bacterial transcription activator, effector binding domain n=1 Tax=Martelella mediterranea DSM 17316 TaxID=1122214 RepID=A0A1U9YYP6_9HYPH|nr:GyrI-like domain-containing protein [Martelella mediterranea]AQZ50567.1 hypothetical protein Mame_01198 [Martelella mediterranea DSM 17316]